METEQWESSGAHTLPTRLHPTDIRGPPSSPVCWPHPVPTGKLSVAWTKGCPHFLKLSLPLPSHLTGLAQILLPAFI